MENKLFNSGKIVIYTDGGSRGNPGPAAVGIIIGGKKYSKKIGEATNNVAEYKAVIFALQKLKALIGKRGIRDSEVEIRMDSEFVAMQLNGQYKVKDIELQPLFIEIWNLKMDFKKVDFIHISRGQNTEADKLVNEALDS